MDPDDEAPPPYSAVDPLASQTNNRSNNGQNLRLRGGNSSRSDAPSSDGSSSALEIATITPLPPANFSSAAAYFVERPPPIFDAEPTILEHQVTIYHRSQSKDFPRRPRCWGSRTDHISQQDWDTFLRYLFPPHLGLASASAQLPRQLRAQIQRDRKDRPQESDEQRRLRISAVITEWNQYFFEPRAVRIVFVYVTDPQNAPLSPLCPRCYPAATKVSHDNRSALVPNTGRGRGMQPSLPLTPGQPIPPMHAGYPPAQYSYPNTPMSPGTYAPYGNSPYPNPQPQYPYYPPQPLPYQQQWGWNPGPWPQQQQMPSSSGKGGAMGWIASLASQAQKYGERISEQAERYGDQISAHAEHYGRQVEEQAMAHGRWIEEQAGLQGRKVEHAFGGYSNQPPQGWPVGQPYYPNAPYTYGYALPVHHTIEPAVPPTPSSPQTRQPEQPEQPEPPQQQRARRASTVSVSSDSSFSSIDSLSTTSELSSSDLATVRAQLLSLDDHHDRDLHDAAIGLRRQLDVLRESRRQSRLTGGRCNNSWRNGWGSGSSQSGSQCGRTGWGRWESPQQHQRSWAERRAVKEETKATRKAFRDVLRRAREDQRERRRLRRHSKRGAGAGPGDESATTVAAVPLDQRLQNLELSEHNRESRSTVQSFPSPTRSVSEVSTISSPISTPSTVSLQSNRNGDTRKTEGDCSKSKLGGSSKADSKFDAKR